METESHKTKRGGRRQGAGRPKGNSKLYAFRADEQVSKIIDKQENKTNFIRDCILQQVQASKNVDSEEQLVGLGVSVPAIRIKPLTLPFFDIRIVAGFPLPLNSDEVAQDIELLKMLCPHPDSSYLIRVQGDSMVDAGINDGDILIVDKSMRQPSSKQIAVCELNGEYTVKYVEEQADNRWLVPANPDYPKIRISEGDEFNVWGVVTFIIHKSC